MKRLTSLLSTIVLCLTIISGTFVTVPPKAASAVTYQYNLQAIVKIDGTVIQLPKPIYFTDVYMGVWNEYDLSQHPGLDLGTKVYYIPNQQPGPYYIGPYSSENFGDPATVRRRLQIIKDAGLYPAIHIMSRHLINSSFQRYDWNDYGAKVNGVMRYSYELFRDLYRPILEELRLPYILIYDMWGFNYWAPANIPNDTFDRLYWDEFEEIHWNATLDDYDNRPTDLHIRIREYTSNYNLEAYYPAIYLFGANNFRETGACANLRVQLLEALGNPDGTGRNPYNNDWGNYNGFFWIHWYVFTPDVRACPGVGNHGLWNMVNTNQIFDDVNGFNQAQAEDAWTESVDNVGPRYFYGYIHHIHDKRSISSPRHASISGTNMETSFLTYKAAEKGMMFTGVWNEYAESIAMEPSNNVGSPADEHTAWVNNRPVFLDSFKTRKIPVVQPPQLMYMYTGYWPLNNSGADFSGNGHTLGLMNGAGYSTDHHEGSYSLNLDGVDDYANAGTINLGNQFTIVAWVKMPSRSNIQTLIANSGGGCNANGFRLFVNAWNTSDRKIIFETGNGSTCSSATTNANVFAWDQWNMVAVMVDRSAGIARIYYNGNDATSASTILTNFNNNATVHLGRMTSAVYWNLGGKLDDVRIYNRMLTAQEISNLYNQ